MDFTTLPMAIKLKIFSHFTPRELCSLIAPVCHQWSKIAQEPILWKTITLDTLELNTPNHLPRVLRRCPLARQIKFNWIEDFTFVSTLPIRYNFVWKLDLSRCHVTDNCIANIQRAFPNVRDISIYFLENSVSDVFFERLVEWKYLKRISINLFNADTGDWVQLITQRCEFLEEFRCSCSALNDGSLMEFMQKRGSKLTTFGLGVNHTISSRGVIAALNFCPNLTSLELMHLNSLTDNDLLIILQKLKYLTAVTFEHSYTILTDEFALSFRGVIFPQLKELTIKSARGLNDNSMEAIFKCVPNLQHFELDDVEVSDASLDKLTEHCGKLKYLVLKYMINVTKDCVDRLVVSLPDLQSLITYICPMICRKVNVYSDTGKPIAVQHVQ